MVFEILRDMAALPQAQEAAVAYLTECLSVFVKKMDTVLICFPQQGVGSLSRVMEQAVLRCGACPVVWGADRRWKALLQLAFYRKATAIIGAPLIVLGLTIVVNSLKSYARSEKNSERAAV